MKWALCFLLVVACGDDDAPMRDGGTDAMCAEGAITCRGPEVFACMGGTEMLQDSCEVDEACVNGIGCALCQPGRPFCTGEEARICNEDGNSSTLMETCGEGLYCRDGSCRNPCAMSQAGDGAAGCDFVSVPALGAAASLVVINRNEQDNTVTLMQGETVIETLEIGGIAEERLDLPASATGSVAYRLHSTFPVVVVQIDGENDGTLLLSDPRMGSRYRLSAYMPAATEAESFTVIVPIASEATVSFTPSVDIEASGDLPAMTAGETAELTVVPDVPLRIAAAGDLTGSLIDSTVPVSVFSGVTLAAPPAETDGVPVRPSGAPSELSHGALTDVAMPTNVWGTTFVAAPSATRDEGWREPDLYRVIADEDVTVSTTLEAPNDTFALTAGEARTFAATTAFGIEATANIAVMQILVATEWLETPRENGGATSAAMLTPSSQMRSFYYHTAPTGFADHYVVALTPAGSTLTLDGVDTATLDTVCTRTAATTVGTTAWEQLQCRVAGGLHLLDGTAPFTMITYGYAADAAYAIRGGTRATPTD